MRKSVQKLFSSIMAASAVLLVTFGVVAGTEAAESESLKLQLRSRTETDAGSGRFSHGHPSRSLACESDRDHRLRHVGLPSLSQRCAARDRNGSSHE